MNRKEKTFKKIQGSISVLLVIILLPMMTFSAVIVDVCRVNMAKQMMSSAGDLTMNTALANYDTILKDVYGLFAMSQAEGMSNDELGEELNKYFAETLSSYGVVSKKDADEYVDMLIGDFRDILNGGNIDTTNFLELNNIDLAAVKMEGSSLANASVLRKQIVEYMKYRAPMELGLSFLESLTCFEKLEDQNVVVEAQVTAQESTQDVTKACQTLIKLIREYDTRVAEINSALTGVTSAADSAIIPLEDYDTHVTKYLSSWNENYKHINLLTNVFLANPPSADGVYLSGLSYGSGERYVDFDGNLYSGSNNTGIQVSVQLAGDAVGAKQQIDQQIGNLNNNYKGYVSKYSGSMLRSDWLYYPSNNVGHTLISSDATKESNSINGFINFEKFLLDQSDNGGITYSQLKTVLEQLAVLDQYRANYERHMATVIDAAEAEQQAAQTKLNNLNSKKNGAAGTMNSNIQGINTRIESYVGRNKELSEVLSFLGTDNKQSEIEADLSDLPNRSVSYAAYYDRYIASGNTSKYFAWFEWILDNSTFVSNGTDAQKNIIKEAKNFVAKYSNKLNEDNFVTHMKKLKSNEKSEELYKLLLCLIACHTKAQAYQKNIAVYNDAASQISGAETVLSQAKKRVQDLNNELNGTLNSVRLCNKGYDRFVADYQADAYYYGVYINAAKNTVGAEAQKIRDHFAQLIAYLKELREDQDAINAQIVAVKNAIKTYNENLDNWDAVKTSYENTNGGDSFSSQTSADIEKAKTEYDAELYETLDTFTVAIWNEYDELYSKLTDVANFTYGSKRIDQIGSADDLISAISGVSFSVVVTVEEANQKLETLYKGETVEYDPYTMNYTEPKQLGFLAPQILQIQALKYLNSSYPDSEKMTQKEKDEAAATESEYKDAKNQLTGNAPSEGQTKDEATNDFGYTFEALPLLGNLPSASAKSKEVKDSKYTLKETGEGDEARLDASSGVSRQAANTSSVLSGIGNIATTAVENLYVLDYVFENFSYNTIVQEQVLKQNPVKSKTAVAQINEADLLFGDVDKLNAAKDALATLSNYPINADHNYLFGGEIEYILFGNTTPSKNVTSTKASIYAIRFAFNCIYAFTNSGIRNSTMTAGLAVQAATFGIVPYQVVQIVLQLALAAAESAVDLSAMDRGLAVAVVKTGDTWSLSVSNGQKVLEDAAKAASRMVADSVSDMAAEQIKAVTNGLNDLVDASAEELRTAIGDMTANMQSAAEGVLESVLDHVTTAVMAKIEEGLNSLQNFRTGETTLDQNGNVVDVLPSRESIRAEAQSLFQDIRNQLDTIINDACGENQMALQLAAPIKEQATKMIDNMEDSVITAVNDASDANVAAIIATKLNDFKLELVQQGTEMVRAVTERIQRVAANAVSQSSEQLKGYISQCGDDLSEEAAKAIQDEVNAFAENFVDTTLTLSGSTTQTDVKSSPVAMFQFGYKDYLMLLTYISICASDTVLLRTADVIQMNIQSAKEGAALYQHAQAENFLMSNAYTYISVSATANLDMFFMDFSIFADQVAEETDPAAEGEENPDNEDPKEKGGTKITYNGLLGY